ncbi:MAG: HTH domain-containing protein [Planctomycetota bacterium]|nr:HTH domain-containing protein [Planctomycetota bacterium]
MPDRPTLIRQWQMLRQLSASRHGCCIRDLAAEYEVSEKTIRRDLDALADGGFDLVSTTGNRGQKQWRLEGRPEFESLHFDLGEIAALYLGRRFLEPLAGTTLWDAAQSAFVKLQKQFSPDALRFLESLARAVHETTFG